MIIFSLTSCRKIVNGGFYEPLTLDTRVPDGPEEFQAGWHAGCRSALANREHSNAAVYRESNGAPSMGNGIYQHSSTFQTAWGSGWFACILHNKQYLNFNSMRHGPLQ